MTVSIKAGKKVTMRRFAKAAIVAALLSTLGAAPGIAGRHAGQLQRKPESVQPENLDAQLISSSRFSAKHYIFRR
jgi:hypothetical protein